PYVDRLVFKPFPDENVRLTNVKTGDADVLIGNPAYKDIQDLKNDPSLAVKEIPGLGFSLLLLNTQQEPFDNPAVRRAFSYAIDREQIRDTVFFGNGRALDSAVPQTIPWAYADRHPYLKRDVAKAKQELSAAGKPNGVAFTLQISNSSPEQQQIAELLKDQIKDAGLEMEIQLLEFATIIANAMAGTHQAVALGTTGDVDPDGNLYALAYTNAGMNIAKYSNLALDKLLDEARATLDQGKRAALYKQAQQILFDDQPFIVYYNPPQITVTQKSVQNYPQTYNSYWGARDLEEVWKAAAR
ncbi:MAG: ABC transporter substrate-binding protein, partial [Chloroflexota bacterium]